MSKLLKVLSLLIAIGSPVCYARDFANNAPITSHGSFVEKLKSYIPNFPDVPAKGILKTILCGVAFVGPTAAVFAEYERCRRDAGLTCLEALKFLVFQGVDFKTDAARKSMTLRRYIVWGSVPVSAIVGYITIKALNS